MGLSHNEIQAYTTLKNALGITDNTACMCKSFWSILIKRINSRYQTPGNSTSTFSANNLFDTVRAPGRTGQIVLVSRVRDPIQTWSKKPEGKTVERIDEWKVTYLEEVIERFTMIRLTHVYENK